MQIECKELNSFEQFEEISKLQNIIWKLSDRDIISTITLKALSMKYPLMGLVMGAFIDGKMVGFVICMPSREPLTLYGLIMGVLPEYQKQDIGNKLGIKILEKCLKQGINKICWTFDPLDSALGHLYFNKWGAIAARYETDCYQLADEQNSKIPQDRFVVDCNLNSNRVIERINKKIEPVSLKEAMLQYPIASDNNFPNSLDVLVKIPNNFSKIKISNPEVAFEQRMQTRIIFNEFITKRKYFIASMLMDEIDGERQFFYLLEKRSYI
jgi:predicted GNAT superfamily acetyltransferase